MGVRRHGPDVVLRALTICRNYWSGKIPPTESLINTVDEILAVPDLYDHGEGNMSGTYPNFGQMIVGVPKDHPTLGDPGLSLVDFDL